MACLVLRSIIRLHPLSRDQMRMVLMRFSNLRRRVEGLILAIVCISLTLPAVLLILSWAILFAFRTILRLRIRYVVSKYSLTVVQIHLEKIPESLHLEGHLALKV